MSVRLSLTLVDYVEMAESQYICVSLFSFPIEHATVRALLIEGHTKIFKIN